MTSTSDWLHFHQSNPSAATQTPYATTTTSADLFFPGRVSDATVVSTNMSPTTSPAPSGPAQLGPTQNRVSKPARKRTRASRRTPTTLLNTDTSNFRAMVQQFTGGPSSNFDISGPGPQMLGNGMGRGMGENYTTHDHGSNINMNMGLTGTGTGTGTGGGSSSSENRSMDSFHF
uniref:VQ domain-containing protein n=1 Tax=Chenopodium quinoa TaxID=63459 RepID=A0A803KWX9_CHEQI